MRFDERLGPKILIYHDLTEPYRGDVKIGKESFARQIELMLRSGYEFIPLGSVLEGTGNRKQIALTFDDGFTSFLGTALPVLEEHGIPSTVYCSSGFAGRAAKSVSFLSWDEMVDLSGRGVDIGCHCISHLPLNEIGASDAQREIVESTEAFRDHGLEPTTLAYPFGRYNDHVKEIVRQNGYDAAVSVMIGGHDMFELRRRLLVGNESDMTVRFRLSDHFLDVREAVRAMVPDRFLKQEQPIEKYRWGFEGFDSVG